MRLSHIEIERFGVWEGLQQPLSEGGLTVLYGPNGTGKSTLLRFVRALLFGYQPEDRNLAEKWRDQGRKAGTLRVTHRGNEYRLSRASTGDELGELLINGVAASGAGESMRRELLGAIDPKLFQSVFALGLPELQQLGTLEDEDVAQHIYAMTLGPEGRRLQAVSPHLQAGRRRLIDLDRQTGRLVELQQRQADLQRRLAEEPARQARYRQLINRLHDLEGRVESLTSDQQVCQSNLVGANHLHRVWGPWSQSRRCRQELTKLPELRAIAPDVLSQLDRLDEEIARLGKRVDRRRVKLADLEKQARIANRAAAFCRYAPSLYNLFDRRASLARHPERISELQHMAAAGERSLDQFLATMGRTWTIERLDGIDVGSAAYSKLISGSRDYLDGRAKHFRRQKLYKRRQRACHNREIALRAQMVSLGITGESLDTPLQSARERLDQVVQLGRLQLEAAQLRETTLSFDQQMESLRTRLQIPAWVYTILFFFAVAGIGLMFWGVVTSLESSAWIGAIYFVLGIMSVGTTWALKLQHEREVAEQVRLIRDQRRMAQSRLHAVRNEAQSLVTTYELMPLEDAVRYISSTPDGLLISQAAARLADLERLHRRHLAIRQSRLYLGQFRERLRESQRKFGEERNTWCRLLSAAGFDESVDVDESFRHVQKVAAAKELRQQTVARRTEQAKLQQEVDGVQVLFGRLTGRMQRPAVDASNSWKTLQEWEGELQEALVHRKGRRRLVAQIVKLEKAIAELLKQQDQLQLNRNVLLSNAGATDRPSLIERLKLWEKRREWELQLQQAERELAAANEAQPTLAIVETDLLGFQLPRHQQNVQQLTRTLSGIESSLKEVYEELGSVKQELRTLEADTRPEIVRLELQNVHEEILRGMEDWYALDLADDVMDGLRNEFERSHQPELLAEAIPYLRQLTCGRYVNIWTPLGKHALCVDDDRQHSWPVEHLSGGTREQLFLAIRLAMVRRFAKEGIELPMVLDDVTVNFDDQRSEAAADTLIEIARQGQQLVVLTSHEHFAEVFKRRGVNPFWLPTDHSRRESVPNAGRRAG
jgi:uncharacterized protein YhaN